MAIPQMFNAIKPPVQMGVVGAMGQKVTPQTVKTTGAAIQKQTQEKEAAAKSAPMDFSEKEIAFLRQVKAQGMDKNEALAFIQQKRQPQPKPTLGQQIKNVGEGMVSFAGGLPKVIAETGVLDKPVNWLAGKVVNPIRAALGKEELTPEQIGQQKFSEMARGSQVGGDPESKLAKRTETAMDVAGLAAGAGAIVKGLGRRAAKTGVSEVIGAKGTQRQMAEAIADGRVKPGATGIRKFLFGSTPEVVEKQSIQNAVNTITREIKNPAYKKPTVLFNQIDDLIESKARSVSNELKNLKIGSFTKAKADTYKLIENGIIKNDAVNKLMTPKELKNLQQAISSIKNAKTADDLWAARKALDLATPDSVKKATSISSDILQYRASLWKQARGEINDLIEASAEKYGKEGVKNIFKTMSELYQAQDNILSKAKDITTATKGVLSKQNLIKAAVGAGTIYGGNKILDGLGQ